MDNQQSFEALDVLCREDFWQLFDMSCEMGRLRMFLIDCGGDKKKSYYNAKICVNITYHFSVPSNLISGMHTIFLFKYSDEIFNNDSLYVFSICDRLMVNCRISSSSSHSCWFFSWSLPICSECKPFKYLP